MDTSHLVTLSAFRAAAYAAFGRRRDSLFELCDTLLRTGPIPSLPWLSIQPRHQRRWGSLYDALSVGQITTPALEHLLGTHPLAGGEPIDAVDVSVWPRCDAETSPERGMYYHASRHPAAQPIVAWALRLGLFLDRPAGLCPGELDGPDAGATVAPAREQPREQQCGRRRAD